MGIQNCLNTEKNKPAKNISIIIVYETSPISRITGYFTISNIFIASPSIIWEKTKENAGIDENDFNNYFKYSKIAYAYMISHYSDRKSVV